MTLPPLPPHLKVSNVPAILASVLGAVVSLALIGGLGTVAVVAIVHAMDRDVALAESGDCIDFVVEEAAAPGGPDRRLAAKKVNCDDEGAAFVVGVRLGHSAAPCPSPDYAVFAHGGFDEFKLCLIPNVADGDCFQRSETRTDRFACTEGPRVGAIRVLRVIRGSANNAGCRGLRDDSAGPAQALTYPDPPTTICAVPFGSAADAGTGLGT